uniref:Uncharacterized protein n=1 Tax=Anguilla anguilla TaxID=7936 RepID=A0A0E9RCY0_ANGAN
MHFIVVCTCNRVQSILPVVDRLSQVTSLPETRKAIILFSWVQMG